jgi:hypothetical protein
MRRGGGRFSVSVSASAAAAASIGVDGASAGEEGCCSSMVVSLLSAMVRDMMLSVAQGQDG